MIECQTCLISRDQCYRCMVVDQKIPSIAVPTPSPKLINFNFKEINEYIVKCMSGYSNSLEPSVDEVIIAWLVCEIEHLQAIMLKPDITVCERGPCPFYKGTDKNGYLLCTLQIEDNLSNKGLFDICQSQKDRLDSLS